MSITWISLTITIPGRVIDLSHLTGPTAPWSAAPSSLLDGSRAAHLHWEQVLEVISDVWGDKAPHAERQLAAFLRRLLDDLTVPWAAARVTMEEALGISAKHLTPPDEPQRGRVLQLAAEVADDHRQRAVDAWADSPEQLDDLRRRIAAEIADPGIGEAHVRPWTWRAATSGGSPF